MLALATAGNNAEKAPKNTPVLKTFWGAHDDSEHPRVSKNSASVNLFHLV